MDNKELLHRQRELEKKEDLFEPKSKLKDIDLLRELTGMIDRVNEGYEDELEIYVLFSDAEKAFKSAKESILESALNERLKYPEKTLEKYGKKISISQSGRYDFKSSDIWVNKKTELTRIENDMKLAYKAAIDGKNIIDENGEIIPAAAYTSSKQSIKLG